MEGNADTVGIDRRGVLAALPAALVASSCGRRRDPDALVFWAMSYEGDYSPHLMPSFTAATGIDVVVQSIPWTAAHEKLLTAHAGGTFPDVLMLPNSWISEFRLIGALAEVPSAGLLSGLIPGLVDSGRVGGRSYAVPWSVAPLAQFYRRDILADAGYDAPPETWEGWRTMGHAIKRRRPDEFVFLMLLNYEGWLFTMLAQNGANVLRDNNTRGNFQTPEAREAFAFHKSLYDEKLAPLVSSTEVQDPLGAFATGQFAIWCGVPNWLLDFRRRSAEISPGLWGAARVAGPRGPGPTVARDASLGVSAASRRPREAWALVRHLTSAASELRYSQLISSLPARTAAWRGIDVPAPVLRPFAEQARNLAPAPMIVEWERIQIEVTLIAERIARGLMTLNEGLIAADARADRILEKRRALVEAGRIL